LVFQTYLPLSNFILYDPGPAVKLAAWTLELVAFFFHNFFRPSTLKPSGNCLPVDQGLRVINSVLDPRSDWLVSGLFITLSVPIRSGLKFGQAFSQPSFFNVLISPITSDQKTCETTSLFLPTWPQIQFHPFVCYIDTY